MKFGIITKKRMELIELYKKLHQLEKEFKKEIKNLENKGNIVV